MIAVLGLAPAPAALAVAPADAVADAVNYAANRSVTSFISVVDRGTGAITAQTGNAQTQVASESIMKLLLASYYLVLYGGYAATPDSVKNQLAYMLEYSDDATASALFSANAVPTIAARYGLGNTTNASDRVGHWGAVRITAGDMTRFLFQASQDPAVGPWLIPVMAQTAPNGSDGFDQHFGLNALGGDHGSKQGWGCDSFWTSPSCAIHSVGYTDRSFVAVLQLSTGYPDPMRDTATHAAQVIQQSTAKPPPIGSLDAVANPDENVLTAVGWAADPDAPGAEAAGAAGATGAAIVPGAGLATSRWLADVRPGDAAAGDEASLVEAADATPGLATPIPRPELAGIVGRPRRGARAMPDRARRERPVVGQARPLARGDRGPDAGDQPAWERPRRFEAYPSIRSRVVLPSVPGIALGVGALIVAAALLFILPALFFSKNTPAALTSPSASSTASASIAPTASPAATPLTYTVQVNDTLIKIAKKFKVTTKAIQAANPSLKNANVITIGQVLTIPTPPPPDIIKSSSAPSPSPSKSAAP